MNNHLHPLFHYSVTIHTDNKTVLGCLRAISQDAQAEIDVRIPSGGTKVPDWERANHHATFRFTSEEKRDSFLNLARQVLRTGLWQEIGTNDKDPATPQG